MCGLDVPAAPTDDDEAEEEEEEEEEVRINDEQSTDVGGAHPVPFLVPMVQSWQRKMPTAQGTARISYRHRDH